MKRACAVKAHALFYVLERLYPERGDEPYACPEELNGNQKKRPKFIIFVMVCAVDKIVK